MIQLGKYNKLKAVRQTDNGIYFMDREEKMEALLPNKFLPDEIEEDEYMRLFIFKDHENRLTATTQKPKITLHHFACLKVVSASEVGAFLDWGLDKDLFVPFKEQPADMEEGKWYMVYLYIDEQTDRLVATGRYLKFLEKTNIPLQEGQPIKILIDNRTDMGYNVIIGHRYQGLIYDNEIFEQLRRGDEVNAFVKKVRSDGKIDVSLQAAGLKRVSPGAKKIIDILNENEGFIPLTDKSPPEEIYRLLSMSKKTFKQAIGGLYKKRGIKLEKDGIRLGEKAKQKPPPKNE